MSSPEQAQGHQAHSSPTWSPVTILWTTPHRFLIMISAIMASFFMILVLSFLLSGRPAVLILDYPSLHFPYPLTIQNMMHVVFFVGLGELFVRWRVGSRELAFLKARYLPEDSRTVLMATDLGPVRKRVANEFDHENGFLPSLINLVVLQFQSSGSIEQASAVMGQHLDLMSNRVDMRYGLVRFIAWVIPTLGFIGTVFSLGASLSSAGDPSKELNLNEVARTLGVGFDCTMVALVQSAFLVFILHLVQEREESALNNAGDYTLRNLINRLYTGK